MADTQVKFVRCSQSTYDELEKDDNTVYFILDKGKIYQGLTLVSQTASVTWDEYEGTLTSPILDEAILDEMELE